MREPTFTTRQRIVDPGATVKLVRAHPGDAAAAPGDATAPRRPGATQATLGAHAMVALER